MGDALKDILMNMIISALEGFDSMVQTAEGVLTGSSGAFDPSSVWGSMYVLSMSLRPFCYIIIAICLLIEIAQVAQKVDVVTWEHGIKLCLKMVLTKVVIDIAPQFLRACWKQGNIWIDKVLSTGRYQSLGGTITSQIETSFADISGLGTMLGLMVTLLIVSLAIKICGIIVQAIAFGRMFEMYVYLAVSPLPCAFFPLGDGTGGGWSRITQKFSKSFIAVCLQGVMMVICIRLFYIIIGNSFDTMVAAAVAAGDASTVITELCFTMLLAAVVLIMSLAKCGSWAKGIIDAM